MEKAKHSRLPTADLQLQAEPDLLETARLVTSKEDRSKQKMDQEWRAGFEAMGCDPDTNVEYMIPAANEVLHGTA